MRTRLFAFAAVPLIALSGYSQRQIEYLFGGPAPFDYYFQKPTDTPMLNELLAVVCRGADPVHVETGTVFWHMVDLVWIVMFPIIYLVR